MLLRTIAIVKQVLSLDAVRLAIQEMDGLAHTSGAGLVYPGREDVADRE